MSGSLIERTDLQLDFTKCLPDYVSRHTSLGQLGDHFG